MNGNFDAEFQIVIKNTKMWSIGLFYIYMIDWLIDRLIDWLIDMLDTVSTARNMSNVYSVVISVYAQGVSKWCLFFAVSAYFEN